MPYVVTQSCCSDASCVIACPVNCIHPAPGEPGFAEAEMLYVDPRACVDCGACATACPVDALKPHTALTEAELPFVELNRLYFADHPHADRTPLALVPKRRELPAEEVRVAVVGAGPAGMYVADELLKHPGVSVDVLDRLPTPYGLVRAGVAPDHQHTKQVTRLFAAIEGQPGFRYRLGVELGRDVGHADLAARYHAVFYAVGAAADRSLGIPGEDLLGCVSATEVVGWYNAHPDHADVPVDLGRERVVVVGNGNVALDVARVLTTDAAALAGTDVADLPLATLRGSRVREVVVLGRRGPDQAAFTVPELVGLAGLRDVDVVVESPVGFDLTSAKGRLLAELANRPERDGVRRIVLRFCAAPVRVLGEEAVTGIEIETTRLVSRAGRVTAVGTGETDVLQATMVVRSVGYHGRGVPGLAYDEISGTIPHEHGRVRPGVYVAGWVKRGPSGFIGTNKSCAEESVASFLDDLDAGALVVPGVSRAEADAWFATVAPHQIDLAGWRAIDAEERRRGAARGRPRVKLDPVEQTTLAQRAETPARRAIRLRP